LHAGGEFLLRLRPDIRKYELDDEKVSYCRRCGMRLVLLPNDKRQGFCFDCIESLMAPAPSAT